MDLPIESFRSYDLWGGVILMVAIATALFVFTLWVARKVSSRICDVAAVGLVLIIGAYTRWWWDDIRLARILPFSNLIVISNWFAPMAAALAAFMWKRIEPNRLRQVFAATLLLGTAFYSLIHPLLGEPPRCIQQWRGPVCMQTSFQTCSAAAAATLLTYQGIGASEQEMARLCLTRRGTTWKGLYRGLKLKTQDSAWEVNVFEGEVDELMQQQPHPIILFTELIPGEGVDLAYFRDRGWIPYQPHSVVLFGVNRRGEALIGDPANGLEAWGPEELRILWGGLGLQLVPRKPASSQVATASVL